MDEVDGRLVRQVGRVHRTDEGDVIDLPGQVRHRVGNPHAALAVLGEVEGAPHQRAGALRILDLARDLAEVRLAVMLVEHRLGVEQIHLTGAAIHEQMNDRFGFRLEMRRAGFEIARGFLRQVPGEEILAEKLGQRGTVEPGADVVEQSTAGYAAILSRLHGSRRGHCCTSSSQAAIHFLSVEATLVILLSRRSLSSAPTAASGPARAASDSGP